MALSQDVKAAIQYIHASENHLTSSSGAPCSLSDDHIPSEAKTSVSPF
jgi:hypothetical protein